MKIIFSIITLFSFLITPAFAEDEKEFWDALAKRPDVKITITKDPSTGESIKEAKFDSGVEISNDGLSIDNSGHGAILCTKAFLQHEKFAMELYAEKCGGQKYQDSIEKISIYIEKLNTFIFDNLVIPITKEEFKNLIAKEEKSSLEKKRDLEITLGQKDICNDARKEMSKLADHITSKEFEKNIADTLSVPRPAVMNPCM